ncbi:hypothetical protein [Hydrogenophaga sp. MI9]|uniref:hypothetical protein n=1 Tax=Hydrogenophaga sp. MI9 TaxID=3453719 RepID=UPI003EEAB193
MVTQSSQAAPVTNAKRPYQAPALREFGALHQFTQGTKTKGSDANGTKTKN